MLLRRQFLASATAALAAPPAPAKPRVAALITEYRPISHADVWMSALIEGYDNGQPRTPSIQIASMFVDQFPPQDLSRGMCAKHNIPLHKTIAEALTMGTGKLAVDGVILMAEHGKYHVNAKGQTQYPRYEFFQQIVEVFRRSGRSVPVFNDKHLSWDWHKAKQMVDQSRELKFPFIAGSSIPFTWRQPPLELELGIPLESAVVASYGPKESYGFHALETLGCMVERRHKGETGIKALQCLEGASVWEFTSKNPWAEKLLNAALERCDTRKPGSVKDNVKQPIVFVLDYVDGLKGAVYLLNGHIQDWGFAGQVRGRTDIPSTRFWSRMVRPWSHGHGLTWQMEQLFVTRKAQYPIERTLLATGALAALMDSSFEKNRRIETPHLHIAYKAPKQSMFNTGRIPPPAA